MMRAAIAIFPLVLAVCLFAGVAIAQQASPAPWRLHGATAQAEPGAWQAGRRGLPRAAPVNELEASLRRLHSMAATNFGTNTATTGESWDDHLDGRIEAAARRIDLAKHEDRLHERRLQRVRQPSDAEVAALLDRSATERQARFAALMTPVSLLLGVSALAVLFASWPRPTSPAERTNDSREARQAVLRCVGVLVLLNFFDLACALLALSSGDFWEINPLAARVAGNPVALVAGKLLLVAIGATTLVACWRYRVAQLASWWACALYAVLALRWATYHSMFIG